MADVVKTSHLYIAIYNEKLGEPTKVGCVNYVLVNILLYVDDANGETLSAEMHMTIPC